MEPQTALNNRPRSDSWSGYQHGKPQQEQKQQENKVQKPSFLTKFIQKRTASNDDPLIDDSLHLQPPEPQQPMLSTSLLKKNGPTLNKKKGNSFGRFLKKLGKNSTVQKVADLEDHTHLNTLGSNDDQITDDKTIITPAVHEDDLPHLTTHYKPLLATPAADKITVTISPRRSQTAKDDMQLEYYRVKDITVQDVVLSRSSSFDHYRSHQQSIYSTELKLPSPPPLTSKNESNLFIEPTITVTENNIYTNDDNSTIGSIESDNSEDQGNIEENGGDGDHLSKRLSGGHFGSAGGLIINTLSLSELSTINTHASLHLPDQDIKQYEDQPPIMQKEEEDSLAHDLETGLATPPRGDGAEDSENDLDNFSHSSSHLTSSAEDYARRIWEQDASVYSNLEHVAEWIGNGSTSSQHILKCYMSYFDFSHQRLEDAFRQLCGKLSMKAESQQIDRILEEFSKRYWECNQQAVFGNADVIHAIVYSLVLLNTDLHIAQGERKKMSRPAFIRNTMDAIRSQLNYHRTNFNATSDKLERHHNGIGTLSLASSISLQSQQPNDWKDLKRTPSGRSNYSQNSGYRGKISSSFDLTMDSSMGSYMWQAEMELLLKQLYTSIRHKQIMHPGSSHSGDTFEATRPFKRNVGTRMWKAARDSLFINDNNNNNGQEMDFSQPLTPRSTISSMSGKHSRRRSISSMRSGTSQHSQYPRSSKNQYSGGTGSVNYQAVASLLHHSNLPTSFTSAAPYYKEGMLVRKHLMEQANQKARQRDWKECFMVVDRGEIRMYRLEAHGQRRKSMAISSRHPLQGMISRGASLATVSESISSCDQSSITSELALGGGDWLAHAQMIGRIDLKHTLSNALPSGYSQQRQHAFALQQANGGVYLFQVGSTEQVMEWVTTCNYWAARESKEPLMGGVGNVEYGWGTCLDDDGSMLTLCQWQPPTPPLMASNLGEMAQLDTLLQHIRTLNDELDRHRDLKREMEQRFPRKTPNHVCAMSNFENKTQYLLHEIIKYQNYCDSLENSLALQDKAIQDGKQEQDAP